MTANADAVMVAGDGSLNIGPVGSTLPSAITDPLDAALVDYGYISEDGATFRDEKTREPINVWQSFYAIKYRTSGANAEIELALMQWDALTLPLAFGGGQVVDLAGDGSTGFEYQPPDPEEIDERALVLAWEYDSADFRLIVPRVMITGPTESQLARTSESDLPLTLSVLGTAGVLPWRMQSDHPAWDPAP